MPIDDQYFGSYLIQSADRVRQFRPSLPCSVWDSLSKLDQQTWDQVTKGKWQIIEDLRQASTTVRSDQNKHNANPSSYNSTSKSVFQKPKEVNNTSFENDHHNQLDTNTMPTALSSVTDSTILTPSGTSLINAAKSTKTSTKADELHPANLRKFLSEDHINKTDRSTAGSSIKIKANNAVHYTVSSYSTTSDKRGALIDRGANGSMVGDNMRIIAKTDRMWY